MTEIKQINYNLQNINFNFCIMNLTVIGIYVVHLEDNL